MKPENLMKYLALLLVLPAVLLTVPRKAWSDPLKPYHFDVRDIAYEMCTEVLPIPLDRLDDMSRCDTAFETCMTTLSDLAAQTADLRKFYKEGPYLYVTSDDDYLDFYEKFRKEHICLDMATYDDGSGVETLMSTSFERTYDDLKSSLQSCYQIFPTDPIDRCGNGVKDRGEMCDEGALNGKPGHCSDDCRIPIQRTLRAPGFFQFNNPDAAAQVMKWKP
jgi:hypothetical protein